MKIAINTLPLKTGHKGRGVGSYTRMLLESLKHQDSIEVEEFVDKPPLGAKVVHYPWFDLFFRTLKIEKSQSVLVTVHDVIPLVFPEKFPIGLKGKISLFFQRRSLLKSKFVITDSENSKRDIIKYLSVPGDKIRVVYLPVDPIFRILPDHELLKAKKKFNLTCRYLLYVGNANYSKNLPFLIDGFNNLLKDNKYNDLKLVLVNEVFLKNVENIDHPELASLKQFNQRIKEYKLEDSVMKLGRVDSEDLVALYNLASVYVQPSLYEGFGLPVLEAMACGCPVVSSKSSSLPEIGGDACVYFDPRNLKQFVDVLQEVLSDKVLAKRLAELGNKRAKVFSINKFSSEMIEIYHEASR